MTQFHEKAGPFTVKELADILGVDLKGAGDKPLSGLAALDMASAEELSFLDNPKYASLLPTTQAGAVIVRASSVENLPEGVSALVSEMPYATYAKALQLFYPRRQYVAGVHAKAYVAESASVHASVYVGAGAVVDEGAEISENAVIMPNAYIGKHVKIGADSYIGPNVTVDYAHVGRSCILHAGCAIGQDGFGFAYDGKVIVKVPQIGMVKIGDFVEIGANSTVDRGSLSDTEIGDYTKLDNLVQIGHNVKLGRGCQLVSQCGIAGSTTLGDGCIVGGQSGVAGHINITSGVTIAARSGVTKNITEAGVYAGFPAIPMSKWKRMQVAIARLGKDKK